MGVNKSPFSTITLLQRVLFLTPLQCSLTFKLVWSFIVWVTTKNTPSLNFQIRNIWWYQFYENYIACYLEVSHRLLNDDGWSSHRCYSEYPVWLSTTQLLSSAFKLTKLWTRISNKSTDTRHTLSSKSINQKIFYIFFQRRMKSI